MRIVVCGHATLLVASSDQTLLIDPVFSKNLMAGTLAFHPQRQFSLDLMPPPTVLVITHGHFDHFHPPSLAAIGRDIPVVAPRDEHLLDQIGTAGFRTVHSLGPWEEVSFGRTRIKVTGSGHDEPEFGPIICDNDAVFWHMADAEVGPEDGQRVMKECGRVDVVSCKYQPVVNASMSHLRNCGPSFAASDVCDWLGAACAARPRFVFPYASGLAFTNEHAWFNRYAFPLTPAEAAKLLQRRIGSDAVAETVEPGDVIETLPGGVVHRRQDAEFVKTVHTSAPEPWEPVDTSTLAALADDGSRRELARLLRTCLAGPLSRWLDGELRDPENSWRKFIEWGVVWQLVVHAGPAERLCHAIDFRNPALITLTNGVHHEANFFTHISGRTLHRVLRGEASPLLFWLAGDARAYDKIISVGDEGFRFPRLPSQAEFLPADPLTYFLRHNWDKDQATRLMHGVLRHEHGTT
jgi:hypothetical protein